VFCGYHLLKDFLAKTTRKPMKKPPTSPAPGADSRLARYSKDRFGIPRIVALAKTIQPRDLSGRLARLMKEKK
jgi:hypothetical protein